MAFGFQIINDSGRIQVDGDFVTCRLIASGFASGRAINEVGGTTNVMYNMPFSVMTEPPLVLIRPAQVEAYCGGVMVVTNYDFITASPNGSVIMMGQCPFEWAIFSSIGSPVSDNAQFGLEVYTASGAVAYTSRHRHPNITGFFNKPASFDTGASSGGWPNTYGFSGYSGADIPWLFANPLIATFAHNVPGEVDPDVLAGVFAKINSGYNSITVDLRDWVQASLPTFPARPDRHTFNPYHQLPAWFGVARSN